MPIYEGIGSEKQAVVIDFGAAYTKCGFAGETGPRCILKTEVICQETRNVKKVYEYVNKEDLYDLLVEFLHNLYFRHLLVSPKDRRVVIVESLLCPTLFRETLAKVLFRHFEVSSVMFVPSHLVALCTLGVSTALVLDAGYQESVLIPVYEGVPVLHAWQAQPLAAQAVDSALKTKLSPQGESTETSTLTESKIEDIKVRTCFVTTLERAQRLASSDPLPPPPDVTYRAEGGTMLEIPGSVRETAFEVLFEQDEDQMSISTMILDAILKCPVDMRKPLAENLLVMGGTTMTPGFKARLLSELRYLLSTPKYRERLALKTFRFHKPPGKENYVAWLGGGIFGGTDIVSTRSLTKEMYLKENQVPDWASLKYNYQEETKMSL